MSRTIRSLPLAEIPTLQKVCEERISDQQLLEEWRIFLRRLQENSAKRMELLICEEGNRIVGWIVFQFLAGAVANIWPPNVWGCDSQKAIEDDLIQAMIRELHQQNIQIAQAFFPAQPYVIQTPLDRHGFQTVTRAWMIQANLTYWKPLIQPGDSQLTWRAYPEWDWPTFRLLLNQTHLESLDCPEFDQIRSTEETIEALQESAPNLEHWWILERAGLPVGILILNTDSLVHTGELAYLGVIPKARKQGMGRALVTFGMNYAQQVGKTHLQVVVDGRNSPATSLYRSLGFEIIGAYEVYLLYPMG